MERYDAILPAGARIEGDFAQRAGTGSKALIPIEGKTLLARTLSALGDAGCVGRTVLIGTPEVLEHPDAKGASDRLSEGASGPDNIFRGLDLLTNGPNPPSKVMVVTTDLPFLTGELIRNYVASCPPSDICVPLIRKASFEARFPNVPATFVSLRDDVWTAGCLYLMDVAALKRARPHIERVFENRKSKLGMAKLLGPAFVAKWLAKRLTLNDVEAKIRSLLGCSGSAVTGAPPELAFDIDYPEDLDYAIAHANGKA